MQAHQRVYVSSSTHTPGLCAFLPRRHAHGWRINCSAEQGAQSSTPLTRKLVPDLVTSSLSSIHADELVEHAKHAVVDPIEHVVHDLVAPLDTLPVQVQRHNIREVLKDSYRQVRLFVLWGTVCGVGLWIWAAGMPLRRDNPYQFTVTFPSAEGLRPGVPVRLKGVTIGSVKSVSVNLHQAFAVLEIFLTQTRIPSHRLGTLFEYNKTGMMTPEPFIDITPPSFGPFPDQAQAATTQAATAAAAATGAPTADPDKHHHVPDTDQLPHPVPTVPNQPNQPGAGGGAVGGADGVDVGVGTGVGVGSRVGGDGVKDVPGVAVDDDDNVAELERTRLHAIVHEAVALARERRRQREYEELVGAVGQQTQGQQAGQEQEGAQGVDWTGYEDVGEAVRRGGDLTEDLIQAALTAAVLHGKQASGQRLGGALTKLKGKGKKALMPLKGEVVLDAGMAEKIQKAALPKQEKECREQGLLVCINDVVPGRLGGSADELTRRMVIGNRGKGKLQGTYGIHHNVEAD